MFDHEDDFDDIMATPTEGDKISIHGNRQTKTTIVIDKNVERNPDRDARALAFYLSTSIDYDTLKMLAERLFYEFIAPNISLDGLKSDSSQAPVRKKSTKIPGKITGVLPDDDKDPRM